MPNYAFNTRPYPVYSGVLQNATANNSIRSLNSDQDNLEKRNQSVSRFYEDKNIFNQLQIRAESLAQVSANWNSYGSESPNSAAIQDCVEVLRSLRAHLLVPERLLPSAEGGVSFTFVSDTPARGAIDVLNTSEAYMVLYDLQGNSQVLEWPKGDEEKQAELIEGLRDHLRSQGLASFSL